MPALSQHAHLSVEDYLDGEIFAETKHEYLGGIVHAMAGGTVGHSLVSSNLVGLLFGQLRGKACRVFNSDMKIRIELPNQTRFYYPDAMVVCESNSGTDHFQERPVVIFEVFSDSTRRTDLGEKRDAYMALGSLKVLVFVETEKPAALVYRRQAVGGFLLEEYFGMDGTIALPEIGVDLTLAEIYERVGFEN